MNHRWEIIIDRNNQKLQQCVKCGVYREWVYGDIQAWGYAKGGDRKPVFKRPECICKKVINRPPSGTK